MKYSDMTEAGRMVLDEIGQLRSRDHCLQVVTVLLRQIGQLELELAVTHTKYEALKEDWQRA